MNVFYDFIPVILFFIAYKVYGIFVATAVLMVASGVQITYQWLKYRKVDTLQIIVFVLILVFGGATIWLQDAAFLEWKVSIVNWLFGLAFLLTQYMGEKSLIQRLMEKNVVLPKPIWLRLNLMWALFFIAMGFVNLFVAHHFSLDTWVKFKVFGILGLTVIFVIIQSLYLYRHMDHKT